MRKRLLVSSIFLIFDGALLWSIFRLSVFLRNFFHLRGRLLWIFIEPMAQVGVLLGIVLLAIMGLYPGYGLTAVKELERTTKAITLSFFLLAATSYLNKPFQDISRLSIIISWLLALVALPLVHFILRNLLSRFGWYGIPVVIFGEHNEMTQSIVFSLKRMRRLGWRPLTVLPLDEINESRLKSVETDVAIFIPSENLPFNAQARLLNQHFRKVVLIQPAGSFGSVWVEPRDLDGQLGLEFHYHLFDPFPRYLKRFIDFTASLILLIVLSPVLLFLGILIRLDSPGPVFYHQERLGRNFKRFHVIKFRTMVINAEQKLSELLQEPALREEYETFHKLNNDPRITSVGKWLRRFSLDELPQLWNVLTGEMSLIGPRAYMPSELKDMGEYAPIILRIRPGLTGWWQVMGRHNTSFQKRLEMDEYYISNWSLWMDFYILLKTTMVVLMGRGV
ncbi:MAG: undecaprenyl-phosphate galactose phosphotransferase WbaP [Anaerolineae bacterium]